MAGAPIVSLPYISKIGADQKNFYFFTSTEVTQDSQGRVNGGKTTLNYSPSPNNYVPAAITNDGGKTWEYLKDSNGKFILGDDARKSLQQGALKTDTNRFIKDTAQKSGIPEAQAKTLQLNQNTAASNAPEPGGDSQGGSAFTEQQLRQDLSKEAKQTRNQFPGAGGSNPLVYPVTLRSDKQDVIKFKMLQYKPRPINIGNTLNPIGERRTGETNIIGTVVLPIPAGISDSNAVTWQEDTLNPLQSAAVDVVKTFITQGGGAAAEKVGTGIGAAAAPQNTGDLKTAFASLMTEAVTGTSNILSRTTGAITNPNMELLFSAPTLRPFNFTFKLSARSDREAQVIRSIIRFFKQGMAPIRTESQLFLKAPHTFQLEYLHRNKPHNYLNKFKECALTSFSVDYAPEGQYATFTDGAMVSYQITMQFSELEPVFNDDYTNDGTGLSPNIGF
jgi:hypothetical protein